MSEKTNSSKTPPKRSRYLGLQVGEQIKLTKRLGNGRLGEVFAAVHPVLARRFAVKILRPALTKEKDVQERLRFIVRDISAFEHAGAVQLINFGQLGKATFYLVTDFIRGAPLSQALSPHEPVPFPRALELLVQLADVLAAAHRVQLVHGDLKPGNILLVEQQDGAEVIKLTDFKLTQALAMEPTEEDTVAHLRIFSTLEYLAPEIIAGERPSPRTDIYSFGALAYRLVCGEQVFSGKPHEVLEGHRTREPVPPSRRLEERDTLPAKMDRIIMRCLEKEPAARPSSMTALCRELRSLLLLTGGGHRGRTTMTDGGPLVDQGDTADRETPLPETPGQVRELLYESIHALGQIAMSQRVASGETEHELSALDDVNEAVRVAWQKHEELEERVEEVRQGLREREASLRYAIIDLSLTRENLAEKGGDSQQVRELEFQVAELEESLGKLEKNRGEVFETLGSELDKHREQVAVDEQRRASSHRRLHGQIEAIRHRLSGEEAVALYRTVSRCHAALTGAEPS